MRLVATLPAVAVTQAEQIGALVVGGDHPGLGVARSLGRRGIPVYIIDDQLSASAFSRYANRFIRVKDLRDERRTVDAVIGSVDVLAFRIGSCSLHGMRQSPHFPAIVPNSPSFSECQPQVGTQ